MLHKIDGTLVRYHKLLGNNGDVSSINKREAQSLAERFAKVILESTPDDSPFKRKVESLLKDNIDPYEALPELAHIAEQLREELVEKPSIIPTWCSLTLAAIVIVAALAVVIDLTLFQANAITVFQYRMALSLLCFVLASVSGLLFAVKANIK